MAILLSVCLATLSSPPDAAQRAAQRARLGGGEAQVGRHQRDARLAEALVQLGDRRDLLVPIHRILLTPPARARPAG